MSRLFAPPPPFLIGKTVLRVYRVPFSTRSSRFPPWIIFFYFSHSSPFDSSSYYKMQSQ